MKIYGIQVASSYTSESEVYHFKDKLKAEKLFKEYYDEAKAELDELIGEMDAKYTEKQCWNEYTSCDNAKEFEEDYKNKCIQWYDEEKWTCVNLFEIDTEKLE